MSLYGYKKKSRPAPWLGAFPSQRQAPSQSLIKGSPRRRKPVPKVSRRRQRTSALAAAVAREVVSEAQGRPCPAVAAVPELREGMAYGWPISYRVTDAHHMRGRAGSLLADKRGLVGLSRLGHRWVEANKDKARELWLLCPRGLWGVPFRDGGCLRCNADANSSGYCGACEEEWVRVMGERQRNEALLLAARGNLTNQRKDQR